MNFTYLSCDMKIDDFVIWIILLHFMILCLCSCFPPKIPICHFLFTILPLLTIPTRKTSFLVHMPSAPGSCPAFQSQSKWILFCILISVLLETFCLDFCITVISLVFDVWYYVSVWTIWNHHFSILSIKT